ncbi:hypothetical protein CN380_27320 [Bacillus sp. AFS017274]|nr:hypothetical protein CN380_27320 [Bacillus sp. AFS017274]
MYLMYLLWFLTLVYLIDYAKNSKMFSKINWLIFSGLWYKNRSVSVQKTERFFLFFIIYLSRATNFLVELTCPVSDSDK